MGDLSVGPASLQIGDALASVISVWAELGLPADSEQANFFDAGGDSYLAMVLAETLSARTGRAVRALAVFEYPTPQQLAELLARGDSGAIPPDASLPTT